MTIDTDDELLALLAAALAATDPVPEAVRVAARAAFTWRSIDEELAALVADTGALAGTGVRSVDQAERELTFRATDADVELLVTGGDSARLLGQVTVAGPGTAKVEHADGSAEVVPIDAVGRFSLPLSWPGPVRVVLDLPGVRLATSWFLA